MPTKKRQRPVRRKRVKPEGPGQPTKCTPQVTEEVCRNILARCPERTAARIAGISPRTHFNWKTWGAEEHPKPEYLHYLQRVEASLAECERSCLLQIVAAAQGTEEEIWVRPDPKKNEERVIRNAEGLVLERRVVKGGDWRAAFAILRHHPQFRDNWVEPQRIQQEGVKAGEPLFVRFTGGPWDAPDTE